LKDARVVPDSLTLLVDSKSQLHGLLYDVDSEIPTPTDAQLAAAPPEDPGAPVQDLQLPADFPGTVRALAQNITRNAVGPYEKGLALERFFRSGAFTYTTDTGLTDSPQAITEFLLHTKKGFCEQFAASFAAMARAVGVPARVAVGYREGTLGADGLYHVTNHDAHAWPEVWITGAGWIPFEPTPGPGFSEPTLGLGTGGPAPSSSETTTSTTPTSVTAPGSGNPAPTVAPTLPTGAAQPQPLIPAPTSHHRVLTVLSGIGFALAAVALGVIAFFAFIAFTLWRRGRRRRLDHDPRRRVLGAWAEALDHLFAAGVPPRPSATALEFALRYAPANGAGDAGPALMELARLQSAAMFARESPTPTDATLAWEQVDTIRAETRRKVARAARWRRRLQQSLQRNRD
jgi:hypothetical protein